MARLIVIVFIALVIAAVETAADEARSRGNANDLTAVRALHPNERGDRIPDFSNCGYGGGGVKLPNVAARETVRPVAGDAAATIQKAIDKVSKLPRDESGFRGAVLLAKGTYRIAGGIHIRSSGVVLRGEGDAEGGTTLVAAGTSKRALVEIGGSDTWREVPGSRREVADGYVPVGARSMQLVSTAALKVGSHVIVHRPSTAEWIHVLGMDHIPEPADRKITQWEPGTKDLDFDRVITAIDGRRITLDAPIVCALDRRYGGASVFDYEFPGRIDHVGIENLQGVSEYQGATDENHSWVFVKMEAVENGWARRLTARHFASSATGRSGSRSRIAPASIRCRRSSAAGATASISNGAN